ncbi:class A beta-lactamase-related serine hydrolase [Pedobacter chinensis]|uniref:Class A beta-lactamase-related serine hydrolase n=1 Tax=Pedobacter chinensis TaxID=2282421 RepID=A0A369PY84_9SPHI|nr:serine hydrolase domain-containing protein [Pedobacter chinensis]RDC57210.1 class A beta-lactamase-related serine hydrolase [Pedobacter chinensis]
MKHFKLKIKLFFLSVLISTISLKAQPNFSKVDAWLADHTDVMGGRVYLMVYKDGKIVYSHGESKMDFKNKSVVNYFARLQGKTADLSAYTASTQQQIASCSKWLSAALVMTFVDEGKLKLDDTVGKYLPVLSQAGKGNITISQCLSHLTGIKAPPLIESLNEMQNTNSMDQAIAQIAALPVEGKPGKVFRYSNTGLQIAGAVIEKISGKSFETLFAERIAQPLDMKNTDFGKGKVALPAGGASSTPSDYMNLLVMLVNKGMFNGKRILSENSINQMQVNRITAYVTVAYVPTEAGGFGYGYGEWIMDKGIGNNPGNAVTSPGLFGSFPWIDNQKKTAGFLMAFYLNNRGRHEYYVELKKLVDEALK